MKKILTVLLVLLLLSGCTQTVTPAPPETVKDLFTQSTEPDTHTDASETESEADSEPLGPIPGLRSYGLHSTDGELLLDEQGSYQVYTGGQMQVNCYLSASGLAQVGVAAYLFVDGKLQPYRLKEDGELAYMHIIYPIKPDSLTPLWFTPITGEEGDCLELSLWLRPHPYHINGQEWHGMSDLTHPIETRLKFEATPPEAELPAVEKTLLSWDIHYEDLTANETAGKSETELQKQVYYSCLVNGQEEPSFRLIFDVKPGDILTLRFELFGCPYGEFSLMFFLDAQPISVEDGDWMTFTTKNGQKTVIEAQVRLAEFEDFGKINAICICRNFCSDPLAADCFVDSPSFYLTAAATLEEHLELIEEAGE